MNDELPAKSSNNLPKLVLSSVILLILGFGLIFWGWKDSSLSFPLPASWSPIPTVQVTPAALGVAGEQAVVKKVIDGDTIELENDEKVRYIGIDTPETVDPRRPVGCFGKEASEENRKLVEGKTVYLVKDVSETDKFGRLLRYVYLSQENGALFINDYLVRQGFAKTSTYPPDIKFTTEFLDAEREAGANNRGLWQKCS